MKNTCKAFDEIANKFLAVKFQMAFCIDYEFIRNKISKHHNLYSVNVSFNRKIEETKKKRFEIHHFVSMVL